jgi:hypothetical protein
MRTQILAEQKPVLDPTDYKTFLRAYIQKTPLGEGGFEYRNTGGRGLGQQDKSTLATVIAAKNENPLHQLITIHNLVLKNGLTYRTLEEYIMYKQRLDRSELESPLCLALGDVNPQIILYLLGVLIYNDKIFKDTKGFINWRQQPDHCALDKDELLEGLMLLKFDEIVDFIRSVESTWTPRMYGGRRTRYRARKQKARRHTRRHRG